MPVLHQTQHRLRGSTLHRERRLRWIPHDDAIRRLDGDALVPNRLDEVDQRADLRRIDRTGIRNQERPYGSPELAVAQAKTRCPPFRS